MLLLMAMGKWKYVKIIHTKISIMVLMQADVVAVAVVVGLSNFSVYIFLM